MSIAEIDVEQMTPPWDEVFKIAGSFRGGSWILVGGLMVQAHAQIAGMESRATTDIDMLVDVMSSNANIGKVVGGLKEMGFVPQEPGLRGAAFHRMRKEELIVDILIAEHLPSRKKEVARVNRWPILETPSGTQALERQMPIHLSFNKELREIFIPDLLGAVILKAAAYGADNRGRTRHLEDAALLASLISDHATELERLQGSDKKRLKVIASALSDENNPAWLKLPEKQRINGMDTLRIFTS